MVRRETFLATGYHSYLHHMFPLKVDNAASKPVETPLDRPNSKFLMLVSGLQIGSEKYSDAPSNENDVDPLPLSPSSTSYRLLMSFLAGRLGDGGR